MQPPEVAIVVVSLAVDAALAAHVRVLVVQSLDWQSPLAVQGAPVAARSGLGWPSSHGSCPASAYADRMRSLKPAAEVYRFLPPALVHPDEA